ncbi:gastric triacylglycerol lipase-like [Cydia pomonella]|uniref:gastric triacylglycerol lipase-like n=1 Tax=Cydia pomonella TaxID=82600 RepID=UPI002ADD60F8|nr:gastric triacylglycerol lipase-like [Cydia pomonella]
MYSRSIKVMYDNKLHYSFTLCQTWTSTKMNSIFTTIVLLVTFSASLSILHTRPEDAKLNFTELGMKYGHSVEEHDVVTEDGYILTLFHIPGIRDGPVLLMHGILDSADTFIIRGKLSLVITMADKGYDVWAGNTRGNKYGRKHKYLDPDTDAEFWDFSFQEAGYYDLAATVDFVLDTTGGKSIRTIGHSQGTSAHFVLLSTRPEYNKKIKGFIALAPIAFLNHLIPPVTTVTKVGPLINKFLKSLGIEELLRDRSAASELIELICSQGIISYDLCFILAVSPFAGFDPKRIEPDFWEVITGHYPAASSRKSLVHFDQIALGKRFANYDFGPLQNFRRYKLLVAPSYNLGKVTTKISLIVGQNDALSRVKDVDILKSLLPREPKYHLMEPILWNHLDFVWANDMDVYLYPYIFSSLEDFE